MALAPVLIRAPGTGIGQILGRDPAVNDGTLFAFDFADTYCWPDQASAPDGSEFINLIDSGGSAFVNTSGPAIGFFDDGFRYNVGATDQVIDLPDETKFAASTGFVVSVVITIETQTQAAKSRICGYFDGSDNTGAWGLYTANGRFYFVINGQVMPSSYTIATFGTGPHTFTLSWADEGDGYKCKLYVDGALDQEADADNATLSTPTDTTTPTLGESSDDETAPYWIGKICRCIGHDLASTELTVADIAAAEWAVTDGRFVA